MTSVRSLAPGVVAFAAAFALSAAALADREAHLRDHLRRPPARRAASSPRAAPARPLNAVVVAGSVGCLGVSDACKARDATLDVPEYIAFDSHGAMFFTNSHDNKNQLLKVEPVRPDPADPR